VIHTGFEKFGKVSYTSETNVNDFVKHLEQGKVMATKCKQCGKVFFPPRADCSSCFSKSMDWKELGSSWKLETYTTAHFGPTGFEDDVPYTLALAQNEQGEKVFARLSKGIKPEETKLGMELKLAPVKLPNEKLSYEFRKA